MKKTLYICLLIFASMLTAQAQQMYRWTDSNGVVHYTEYAPDEAREQILNFTPEQEKEKELKTKNDVTKLNVMQPTAAVLVEIPDKAKFDPANKQTMKAKPPVTSVASLDPTSMDYCQIIQSNLATFDSLEKGDLEQVLFVSQTGAQSRITPEDIQAQYKATIDNLEKYCLQ